MRFARSLQIVNDWMPVYGIRALSRGLIAIAMLAGHSSAPAL